jgi:hypothetical protein
MEQMLWTKLRNLQKGEGNSTRIYAPDLILFGGTVQPSTISADLQSLGSHI